MNRNIVLIGFMGTGKTTIGRRTATKLGLDFYDTDEYIKKCEGMSANDVLKKKGVKYFEGAQRFAVTNICEHKGILIATGGATVCDEKNRSLLSENGIFVWLRATPETIYENTKNSYNKRPEITGTTVEEIAAILSEREKHYSKCDIIIDVDKTRDIDEIVNELTEKIKDFEKNA